MQMIKVNINLKDKEFEKVLAKTISSRFSVNLTDKKQEEAIFITDYDNSAKYERGTIYLTQNKSECMENIIYKFESSEYISKKILYEYCMFYDDYVPMALDSACDITGVCSSAGGTGCSLIAIGIAQEMQRMRKQKVLYVSMEMIPFSITEFDSDMNINRLIYKFFTKGLRKEDLYAGLSLDEYGVSYFKYVRPYNKLLQLKEYEFVKFISAVAETGVFTHIIIDIGNGMGYIYDNALSICDSIIKINDKTKNTGMKEEIYDCHLQKLTEKNIIKVSNKFISLQEDEEINEDLIYVDYSPESITIKDNMLHIYPEKPINNGINDIINKITAI